MEQKCTCQRHEENVMGLMFEIVVIGAEMFGIQINGKPRHVEKPISGCLGRMVNLFDLASSKNRLLTDKPHNDGNSSLQFAIYLFFFLEIIFLCNLMFANCCPMNLEDLNSWFT